ncbi:hypothetical protein N7510_005560 [Penicillium lagena]|uniref:uncharacterized protein n=1 Tax=Penicillium lagena TaxID=94218 RepID=UPI00254009AF|nr:uncharacterized protein N7510_005560 [Penicillium lagena]KAJ5612366.1 hypothetical protein N7510_005560 [Penicillium lagena]
MDSAEMDEMPDQATMMNFALPKVNHQGVRPHDDDIDMWYSSFTNDSCAWDDLAVAETQKLGLFGFARPSTETVADWDGACSCVGSVTCALRNGTLFGALFGRAMMKICTRRFGE